MKWLDWKSCYKQSAKGLIIPEAFSHPAKLSVSLCRKIFAFMEEKGMLKKGDVVCDPFAGIFTTGLIGAMRGYRVVGVELEEKFCKLSKQNIEKNRRIFDHFGVPIPVIIQGDSRKLSEIIAKAEGIVTSPPFLPGATGGGGINKRGYKNSDKVGERTYQMGHLSDARSIDRLKEGSISAVMTSPPYAESLKKESETQTARKQRRIAQSKSIYDGRRIENDSPGKAGLGGGYGGTNGQIGSLKDKGIEAVITSPPYEKGGQSHGKDLHPERQAGKYRRFNQYGEAGGQISSLPGGNIASVITSPPYEGQDVAHIHSTMGRKHEEIGTVGHRNQTDGYGKAEGQIGNESKETYWSAMKLVYGDCWKILKDGGWMAIVVKDFVRAKKRVPLCDNTVKLLEHLGFKVEYRARAWLTEDLGTPDAFTGRTKSKQRKSFFRRLAESKGSPRIDWEEVLICQKI